MALEPIGDIADVTLGQVSTDLNGFNLDDWQDGVFTNRDDFNTTSYQGSEPGSSSHSVGARPEWDVVNGMSINGSNQMTIDATDDGYFSYLNGSLSSLDNLTWEIIYAWDGNPGTSGDNISLTRNLTSFTDGFEGGYEEGYVNNFFQNGDRLLSRVDNGGFTRLIETAVGNDTNQHTLTTTRDGSGNWELLHDGSSLGTTSDSTYTTSDGGGVVGDSPTLLLVDYFRWY